VLVIVIALSLSIIIIIFFPVSLWLYVHGSSVPSFLVCTFEPNYLCLFFGTPLRVLLVLGLRLA